MMEYMGVLIEILLFAIALLLPPIFIWCSSKVTVWAKARWIMA